MNLFVDQQTNRSPIFQVRFGSIFLGDTCYYTLPLWYG